MVVGSLLATVIAGIRLNRRQAGVYRGYRRRVGRSILLGLEFLVAGDIIRTVAVAPTYKSVGVLGSVWSCDQGWDPRCRIQRRPAHNSSPAWYYSRSFT
jgi:hypothetical protein